MALIGEMKYLTIGGKTYQIPVPESGSSVEFTPNLTSGTKVGDLTIDSSTVSLYAPTNTDTKLQIAAVTSGTTYYPVVAANSTTAATRQYDATGLAYAGTNGTTSAVGTAKITLGNSTASGTANNKKGQITLYGSTAYATTIDPGSPTAARTITLPDKAGTIALTSDIPTVPTNISSFTNDAGYITSADVPEGASAYTGTISAVGTAASSGTNNGFARGDHVHNITSSTITTALGYTPYNSTNPNGYTTNTGTVTKVTVGSDLKVGTTAGGNFTTSGTITHANSVTAQTTQAVYPIKIDAQGHISAYGSAVTIPSDVNVTNTAVTEATTYYLTGSTSSSTTTGALSKHASANIYVTSSSSGTNGYTRLTLGNNTSGGVTGGKAGEIRLYGNLTYYTDIKSDINQPSANRTLTLPNNSGTIALTSDIPTVPSAGTTATAIGTTASGGSASTWSKSDHVHNITSSTITTTLGYTPGQTTVQIVRW